MEPTWKQADVVPIIVRVIEQAYRGHWRLVTFQEIAALLLQDNDGSRSGRRSARTARGKQSREWLASNLVSWFSQRITIDESEWARAFERAKIDDPWAYKPVAASST